jgi:MFS family permease
MLSFFVGAAIGGAPKILVLGLTGNLTVVLVVTFLAGLGMAGVNPVVGAVLYERIPVELQTRVFGVVGAVAVAGIPLGSALTGAAVAGIGLQATILVSAVVLLAATVIPLARHLRGAAQQPEQTPVAQSTGDAG